MIEIPSEEPNPDLDPGELTETRFRELGLRDDVIASLRTDRGLAPNVRAAAIKLADKHAEDPDAAARNALPPPIPPAKE